MDSLNSFKKTTEQETKIFLEELKTFEVKLSDLIDFYGCEMLLSGEDPEKEEENRKRTIWLSDLYDTLNGCFTAQKEVGIFNTGLMLRVRIFNSKKEVKELWQESQRVGRWAKACFPGLDIDSFEDFEEEEEEE